MKKEEALILGGTKGLGLEIAKHAEQRSIIPVIAGRSILYSKNFPKTADTFPLDISHLNAIPIRLAAIRNSHPHFDYIFWVAGVFERKPFWDMSFEAIERMTATHLLGPWKALQFILRTQAKPFHLVTIASVSSWRLRENEAIYCALKAAKAAFTRNLAVEIIRDIPGSKVTLVNPAGMRTPFWSASNQDTTGYMDPEAVAALIWEQVQNQSVNFSEIQILRDDEGTPHVEFGPRLPEFPV